MGEDNLLADSLGQNGHFPLDCQRIRDGCLDRRGDQDLSADGVALDTAGKIDLAADDAVFHPLPGPDVSDDHFPGIQSDPHLKPRIVPACVPLVDPAHRRLHGNRGCNRVRCMRLRRNGRTEDRHNTVPDEFDDGSVILLDRFCHETQIVVQHADQVFRIHLFAQNGKASQVAHQNRQILNGSSQLRIFGLFQQLRDHFIRYIHTEGLLEKLIAQLQLMVHFAEVLHVLRGIPKFHQLAQVGQGNDKPVVLINIGEVGDEHSQLQDLLPGMEGDNGDRMPFH